MITDQEVDKVISNRYKMISDGGNWCESCSLLSLEKYTKYINWKIASKNPNLSLHLVGEHKHEIDFDEFSKVCSREILENFGEFINWKEASVNGRLSLNLVLKYQHLIDLDKIPQWASEWVVRRNQFMKKNMITR